MKYLEVSVDKLIEELKEWNNAAEVDCRKCGGSGFYGYGTGYDAVCDNCTGGIENKVTPQWLSDQLSKVNYKYVCKECDGKEFIAWFEPTIMDKPAFCPCCGSDKNVDFVGIHP